MASPPKGTDLEKEKKEGTDLPETKATKIFTNKLIYGDPYDPMVQMCLTQPSTKEGKWLDDMAWGFYEEEPKKASLKGKGVEDVDCVEKKVGGEQQKETSLNECESEDSQDGGDSKPTVRQLFGGGARGIKRKREMSDGQFMSEKIFSPLMKACGIAVEMRPDNPFEWILYCVEKEMKGVKDGNKV